MGFIVVSSHSLSNAVLPRDLIRDGARGAPTTRSGPCSTSHRRRRSSFRDGQEFELPTAEVRCC
jgi:hypothetical protein